MRISLALVIAFILGLTMTTVAATHQGDSEITFFGSIQIVNAADSDDEESDDSGSDDSTTMITAGGSYGYYLTDAIQVVGQGLGMWTEAVDIYSVGGAVKYHFLTASNTVPYVGGQVNASFLTGEDMDDSSGILYGPLAGLKFFVSEKVTAYVEYQYQLYGGDIGDFIDSAHAVMFGISFLFE